MAGRADAATPGGSGAAAVAGASQAALHSEISAAGEPPAAEPAGVEGVGTAGWLGLDPAAASEYAQWVAAERASTPLLPPAVPAVLGTWLHVNQGWPAAVAQVGLQL